MQVSGRMRFLIGTSLLLAAMTVSAQPRVYKWVDANGVVHYSDAPPKDSEGVAAEPVVLPPSAPPRDAYRPVRSTPVEPTAPEAPDVAAALAPAQTQGPDCSTPSPTKRNGQDLYAVDEEPPEPLTAEEIESFKAVIKGMAYDWSGTDVGFACDKPLSRPPSQAVASEGRAANPVEFALESTISSRDTNRREMLRIELKDKRLWVNNRYASLISVSDRVLEFGYKQRTGGAITPTGGAVTELYWRIELDGRRDMKIENVIWANGTLSETGTWELRKPF